MKMGGNNKIAPPNRLARLKTFSGNRRFEKPQTLFVEKSSVLGREMIFFLGGGVLRVPRKWFWHDTMMSCNTQNEKQNV
jgi:hypothetical protein